MSSVVRDPDGLFLCPRCGRPVTCKRRGRRSVWCSSRCRVEASTERRGNRIVGIEPRIVMVVPPKKRLSQWERGRREEIEHALTWDTVVAMVAREPYLLMKVLARVEEDGFIGDEARAIAPEYAESASAAGPRAHKRDAAGWARLLDGLSTQLANGQ